MSLTDKLRSLDQRVLPGTREPEEDAETYLRRVAASRAITPAQFADVMTALREHLQVFPGEGNDNGDSADNDKKDDAKAEAGEESGDDDPEGEKSEENEDDES
jgi:hypothetical protein